MLTDLFSYASSPPHRVRSQTQWSFRWHLRVWSLFRVWFKLQCLETVRASIVYSVGNFWCHIRTLKRGNVLNFLIWYAVWPKTAGGVSLSHCSLFLNCVEEYMAGGESGDVTLLPYNPQIFLPLGLIGNWKGLYGFEHETGFWMRFFFLKSMSVSYHILQSRACYYSTHSLSLICIFYNRNAGLLKCAMMNMECTARAVDRSEF